MVDIEIIRREKIDILNDVCFKSLFRSVEARGMFSRFLSAVTGIDREALLNAKYIGGELAKEKLTERGKIADIIVCINTHNRIIVEMNKYDTGDIFEKNSSYAYSIINESTKKGIRKWPKAILINIDNFNKFNTKEQMLCFKARDEYGNIEHELYNSIHIVLENFKNPNYNIDKEIIKFVEFITTEEFSKLKELSEGDNDYMAGYRKVEDLSTDPEFIGYYDYEEAREHDMAMAELSGIEKGIEQGIERGIQQKEKELILNMKEKGISLEMISEITKLSIEEVKKILNN